MKIQIYHATAGHGHLKIAEVIKDELLKQGIKSNDILLEDALDSTPDWFKKAYTAFYFYSVKYTPLFWGWGYELLDHPLIDKILRPIRTRWNKWVGKRLLEKVLNSNPDVIICTHFLSAELLATAKKEEKLAAKLITVITDFYPHNFWVNSGTDMYWVMSEESAHELEERGIPSFRIKAGGIPVHRNFLPKGNRTELLKKWSFDPARFTLLITSGSFGLGPTLDILQELEFFSDKVQAFVVCAKNQKLEEQIKAKTFNYPVKVFGFIDFMHDLMEASDIMIAKSGGSTTCESLVKGIPMIITKPIPGQEMRNADLLRDRNASFFLESPEQIKAILNAVFNNPSLIRDKKKDIQGMARPDAGPKLAQFATGEIFQQVS
mgnify:CR=1 FL=1